MALGPPRKGIIPRKRQPPPGGGSKGVEDLVAAAVARLEKAWDEYRANADVDRDAIYLYLEPVSNQVRKWKSQGVADEYSLIALKQGIPGRVKGDPYVRLIYCSATKDDPKKRHQWAKVMNWAEDNIETGETFTDCVKKHGGINKCVESARWDLD